MPINLSWRGDEILAWGKNGREKQKGKKGGTEFLTNKHFSMETYGERADVSKNIISQCIHIEYKSLIPHMTLGLNFYSQTFQKIHGERKFFPQQEDFFGFALRYLKRELSRKKGRHFGPSKHS
ncbi:hypothetical protein OUZ56_026232 [Daphnia magna]|uniref:Uncharacterized protein n=1 Tax=Daphnia magna TaxID=35525 RepID=A0ABQ9ZL55_9CRUS|nr:hypothetical protein OUZ56_026232 [Daphnia magna]